MNFLKLVGLVGYLPIIDIPFAPGGKIAVRGASYKGLQFLVTFLIALLVFGILYIRAWYQQHPLLGKILFIVLVWWCLRQGVRFFRALCDDPYTRLAPYRHIELPQETIKQHKK